MDIKTFLNMEYSNQLRFFSQTELRRQLTNKRVCCGFSWYVEHGNLVTLKDCETRDLADDCLACLTLSQSIWGWFGAGGGGRHSN